MLYFIPQIIKSLGNFSNMEVGWLTMIPYICGGIGMVVWGRVSDAMNERRWNLLVACVLSTGGLVLAGYTLGSWWALVEMSVAAVGFYGSKGPFFAMPRCTSAARRSRRGLRLDQLDRQPGWHRRPLLCRIHAGSDWQLRRWSLRAGAVEPHRRSRLCLLPPHSSTRTGRSAAGGHPSPRLRHDLFRASERARSNCLSGDGAPLRQTWVAFSRRRARCARRSKSRGRPCRCRCSADLFIGDSDPASGTQHLAPGIGTGFCIGSRIAALRVQQAAKTFQFETDVARRSSSVGDQNEWPAPSYFRCWKG